MTRLEVLPIVNNFSVAFSDVQALIFEDELLLKQEILQKSSYSERFLIIDN